MHNKLRIWGMLLALLVLALPVVRAATGGVAVASAVASATAADPFPEPKILRTTVDFWMGVFARYSQNQSLIHSAVMPSEVAEVLDFSAAAASLPPVTFERLRAQREAQALADAERALRAIVAADADPARMTLAQRVIFRRLGSGNVSLYRKLEGTLRVQRGLRERTGHALEVAGRYLPRMEQIFSHYDLPVALTRLPLVESSFNLDAYSKVGAAGIWQFMPASARVYMKLNAVQDQRRDPWASTTAAAQYLRDDYQALGSWPLAITAYNYGRGGLLRALQRTHGSTLTDLLERCDNPRFGFASRNFYAEFLAARRVAAHAAVYYGDLPKARPIGFDVVHTRDYVPYGTLVQLSGADAKTFQRLNPSFSDAVMEGRLYVSPDTEIRVPPGDAQRFDHLYAALGPGQRFAHQQVWEVAYRVRPGDVLGRIATRHHVGVAELMRFNHLRSPRLIRAGQTLKIPTGGSRAPALVAAVAHPVETQVRRPHGRVIVHRVLSGQTLGGIAERYQASIAAIRRLNGLRDVDFLRVGMQLRIPTAR